MHAPMIKVGACSCCTVKPTYNNAELLVNARCYSHILIRFMHYSGKKVYEWLFHYCIQHAVRCIIFKWCNIYSLQNVRWVCMHEWVSLCHIWCRCWPCQKQITWLCDHWSRDRTVIDLVIVSGSIYFVVYRHKHYVEQIPQCQGSTRTGDFLLRSTSKRSQEREGEQWKNNEFATAHWKLVIKSMWGVGLKGLQVWHYQLS